MRDFVERLEYSMGNVFKRSMFLSDGKVQYIHLCHFAWGHIKQRYATKYSCTCHMSASGH